MTDWTDELRVNDVYAGCARLSDEAWLAVLLRSLDDPVVDGIHLPHFPPEQVQVQMHGHSREVALREAFTFMCLVKQYATYCERPLRPGRTLLDFGAGWGRIVRLFMNSLPAQDLYAAEPDGERAFMARALNPYITVMKSGYWPPLALAGSAVDYVVSWSVFSHLSEPLAACWIRELARILRPGGLLCFTTQRRAFIDTCQHFRSLRDEGEDLGHPWHQELAAAFPDGAAAKEAFDAGEFLFSTTGGSPPETRSKYGEAIISPGYVRRRWLDDFSLVHYRSDDDLPQALFVLQRN